MEDRKNKSKHIRNAAAELAFKRSFPAHTPNGEEQDYAGEARSFMSFTKGLPHDPATGLAQDDHPERFRKAIDAGTIETFDALDLGPTEGFAFYVDVEGKRRWESPTAGFVFDLQGPDAHDAGMPPAPPLVLGSGPNPELVAELAEVYWLALVRDVPFEAFDSLGGETDVQLQEATKSLASLPFYQSGGSKQRPRPTSDTLNPANMFRGHTKGDAKGPYLSQFFFLGDEHLGPNPPHEADQGFLMYGSIRIDLRVRVATPGRDYMTHWNEWLDVQHAADVRDTQTYGNGFRYIATPRDLATYVHFDALYEAYLNACIWLLNNKAKVDVGFEELADSKNTEGFALFGGPHILTLLTEVATRALKAVRWQKFNTHLRLRPEALAARIAAHQENRLPNPVSQHIGPFVEAFPADLLQAIGEHNARQNVRHAEHLEKQKDGLAARTDLPLLPMAFPEGSPMHPSYGAGHGTVAGACVTILKAFFDEKQAIVRKEDGRIGLGTGDPIAFVPNAGGTRLNDRGTELDEPLRVGDELDKLAANISMGRNMAGVHYYSDYLESLRLGEAIVRGILEEQALCYPRDPFGVSFTSFDGKRVVIPTPPAENA